MAWYGLPGCSLRYRAGVGAGLSMASGRGRGTLDVFGWTRGPVDVQARFGFSGRVSARL